MLDAVCLMRIQYYRFKCRIEHNLEVIAASDHVGFANKAQ